MLRNETGEVGKNQMIRVQASESSVTVKSYFHIRCVVLIKSLRERSRAWIRLVLDRRVGLRGETINVVDH